MPSPLKCENCKASLNFGCSCEDCIPCATRTYCHVCTEMNRVIFRSQYLSRLSTAWKEEQAARKNRMGLQ